MANEFERAWTNWSGYFNFSPRRIFKVNGPKAIAAAIGSANTDSRRIRVSGSRWSFSDTAFTHDYVIDTSRINRILGFSQGSLVWGHPQSNMSPIFPNALLASTKRIGPLLAHIEAGVTVRQLYKALDDPSTDTPPNTRGEWALPTQGGSGGQTVVGAIATSTHGADLDLPPIQEAVRAIHLVDPSGSQHWIERAGSRSITDPTKLSAALPFVTPHYDDDLFFSTLVSMGCFGAVYSVVLEVVPQFGLNQNVFHSDWLDVRAWLTDDMFTTSTLVAKDGSAGPVTGAIEILMSPFRDSDDYSLFSDPVQHRQCIVVTRDRTTAFNNDPAFDNPWAAKIPPALAQTIFNGLILEFDAGNQSDVRKIVSFILEQLANSRRKTGGTPIKGFQIMDTYDYGTAHVGSWVMPVQSSEFAISTRNNLHIQFLDALLQTFDDTCQADPDNKFAGGFSIRFTLPTEAFLGIQQRAIVPGSVPTFTERICHVELITAQQANVVGDHDPSQYKAKTAVFVRAFEELVASFGDLHLHWGMNSLTRRHAPDRYVGFPKWMSTRAVLAGSSRAFDNDFTVRYAISTSAPDWAVLTGDLEAESAFHSLAQANNAGLLPGFPTSHPDNAAPANRFPPTAYQNALGALEVVVLGSDGQACWNLQTNSGWLGWSVLAPDGASIPNQSNRSIHFSGRIAQGTNSDGHPELFVRSGLTRTYWHTWRSSAASDEWDPQVMGFGSDVWNEMDLDQFASSPDVTLDADNHLHLIGRTIANRIFRRCQNWAGWSGWEELAKPPSGVTFAGDPAIAAGDNGVLTVVSRDGAGQMWFSRQASAGSGSAWSAWAALGKSPVIGDPVAVRDASSRLQVFTVGVSPTGGLSLLRIGELTANETWESDWTAVPAGTPPADGRRCSAILGGSDLHVAYLDGSHTVQHVTNPGGTWSADALGGIFTSAPSVAENADGRIEVFAKFANDLLQHRWQSTPGSW